jgi:hypothetical protein
MVSSSTRVRHDVFFSCKEQIRFRFTNPNGTGWFCTSITYPNGVSTSKGYDAANRLTSMC